MSSLNLLTRRRIVAGLLLCAIAGCASVDRRLTKFEPIDNQTTRKTFKFTAFADALYPLDSASAEATRMAWLETWLTDNHISTRYVIASRTAVLRTKGLFAEVYDVFYMVTVAE